MIRLDKCKGSCKVLSQKICVPKETKNINGKVFNMITNKNEAKQWQDIFHIIVNANSIVKYIIQIKNGIMKHISVNIKIIVHAKKNIVRILAMYFCK